MSRVFPSPASQYEPFLFAIVCDEMNGMQLTLVSAIARTGVDPWAEAARIAKLPSARAREVVTALIPRLPGVGNEQSDARAIVDRLIALLPHRGARDGAENRSAPEAEVAISADARRHGPSKTILTALAVCLGVALAILVLNRSQHEAGVHDVAHSGATADQGGK